MSEGVGSACLELQNAYKLDVNVLLYCIWVGASRRGVLNASQIETVTQSVEIWHRDVVQGLRSVRTLMKEMVVYRDRTLTESVRQRIQKVEIDCEHVEQLILAETLKLEPDATRPRQVCLSDAVSNVGGYFRTFAAVSDNDRENLVHIVSAAFPELAAEEYAIAFEEL